MLLENWRTPCPDLRILPRQVERLAAIVSLSDTIYMIGCQTVSLAGRFVNDRAAESKCTSECRHNNV